MKLFRLFPLMVAALLGFAACEENTKVDETPDPVVELKADKSAIVGDGEDKVIFTVFVDKIDRTTECNIINLKDNSILEGNTFATTVAGEYQFKATFDKYASESVNVTVEEYTPVVPECDAPVLTVDKMELKADGEDLVIFIVKHNGEDVTSKATIYNITDNCALEDNSFATIEAGSYEFEATIEDCTAKSNSVVVVATSVEEPETKVEVTLEVDKTEILADGTDAATFTVKVDGVVTTEDVYVFNLATNKSVKNRVFTTTEAGEYEFMASFGEHYSQHVTVVAKAVEAPKADPVIELIADKTEFVADGVDKVTFTVTADGVAAEAYTIYLVGETENSELKSNVFTTSKAGEYKFKAMVEEFESEVITITATEPEVVAEPKLTLSADKTEIVADGIDAVVFEIKEENFNTEDAPLLYNLTDNSVVRGPFTATEAGTYEFVARKGEVESNKVTIVAKAVEPENPEQPENPENPENPEQPENPENPEQPENPENPEQPEQPAKEYKVGDYYEENGNKGIVFAINTDVYGTTWCYVFSLDEAYLEWSTINVDCGYNHSSNGQWMTEDLFNPKYGAQNIDDYPAFKWCIEHGEGWFLPSTKELGWMWNTISGGTHNFQSDSVKAFNKLIVEKGGDAFCEDYYSSSNENSTDTIDVVAFMSDSVVCLEPYKTSKFSVRAAYRFIVE